MSKTGPEGRRAVPHRKVNGIGVEVRNPVRREHSQIHLWMGGLESGQLRK